MKRSLIIKKYQDLKSGKVNISELYQSYLSKVESIKETNSIITPINVNLKKFKLTDNPLSACFYTLKDNVSTKGIRTTGASKMLEHYIPPYSATLYELLQKSNAILTSKSNLDQFAMAGTGLESSYGEVSNVLDLSRISGGSSSGSVNLVAIGVVDFAIGSDTGDSIRRPASFLGVVGYKPSYGLVSRYGVLPYAPSLDHVGVIAKKVSDCALVADQICQFDPKDYTSQKLEHDFFDNLKELKNMKIAIIRGIEDAIAPNERKLYLNALDKIKKAGHTIVEKSTDFSLLDSIGVVYQVISNVEGLSCYGSFTGIPFGENVGGDNYESIVFNNRNTFFNKQVKKRFIMGAYVTSDTNFESVYIHAKKVRTLLINLVNSLLDDVDGLLIPSASSIAPKIESIKKDLCHCTHADDCLILGNFAGLPSITIPCGKFDNMPYGININCKQKQDQKMFDIAYTIEGILGEKYE